MVNSISADIKARTGGREPVEVDGQGVGFLSREHQLGITKVDAERRVICPGSAQCTRRKIEIRGKFRNGSRKERTGLQRLQVETAAGAGERFHGNRKENARARERRRVR